MWARPQCEAARGSDAATFCHVAEREDAQMILREGFAGRMGRVGFGVYVFPSLADALQCIRRGGPGGRYADPVVLQLFSAEVKREVVRVAGKRVEVWVKPMQDASPDARWKPLEVHLLDFGREAAEQDKPEVKLQPGGVRGLRLLRFGARP